MANQTFQDASAPRLEFKRGAGTSAADMEPSAPLAIPGVPLPPQNPVLTIKGDYASAGTGRFNTTGYSRSGGYIAGQWLESTGDFTISFDEAVNAFGFFLTDGTDFGGSLKLLLNDANGQQVGEALTVADNGSGAATSGSVTFFGFTDADTSYSSITFDITQLKDTPEDFDVFGFDDLMIGELRSAPPPNTIPEPASLGLVALSLAGLAAARRRSRKLWVLR